jgi:cytochrome oxidase assembly protein ShyY1
MTNWAFIFTRRWAGYLTLTIIVAIVCCCLGAWQLGRRNEALTEKARVEANFHAQPVPLTDALSQRDTFDESQKWSQVSLTGSYLTHEQLLVRNRPMNGMPGFEVLTPFLLKDGSVFIVDRGWLPTGSQQDTPDNIPSPPTGEVTVIARLKAGEPTLPGRSSVGSNQIATIELHSIAQQIGQPSYTGAYGLMVTETPSSYERPHATPKPAIDEGPHLSYAFQWFVFALLAFLGLGYAIQQEYRAINAHKPEEHQRAQQRAHRRAQKPLNDSQVEDRILDALQNYDKEINSA